MGLAAVKKQRKPRPHSNKRKARGAPLPLDTSRNRSSRHRKTSPPASGRSHSIPVRWASTARVTARGVWLRLLRTTRAERADAAMLALPVLLIALTIAVARWTQHDRGQPSLATLTPGAKHALIGMPPVASPVAVLAPAPVIPVDLPSSGTTAKAPQIPAVPAAEMNPVAVSGLDPVREEPSPPPPAEAVETAAPAPGVPSATPAPPVSVATVPPALNFKATEANPLELAAVTSLLPAEPLVAPDSAMIASDLPGGVEALAAGLSQCRFEPAPPRTPAPVSWTPSDPESFGLALATAARRQLADFVIYNDRYTRLKYPMGDVHPMYGVCTDVIIRAYRALGLDLQELVQKTKTGSGDPNIDHRRVDTLRKFFSRFGESLPISSFAEDYKAGDVVTYWRPQNRHSRTHIAIVSDITGPSGRPLIIHNRGWGPQQEDGLFVDEITGHYRFSGLQAATAKPASMTANDKKSGAKPFGRQVVRTGL